MHSMSHAEDSPDAWRRLRQQSHISVYLARAHPAIRDSESLHVMPQRQIERVGNRATEELGYDLALAGDAAVGRSAVAFKAEK